MMSIDNATSRVFSTNKSFEIKSNYESYGKDLVFIAKRSDGIGERFRAILNAMSLSIIFDAKFGFYWVEKHQRRLFGVESLEEIFSRDFIRKYRVDNSYERKSISVKELKLNSYSGVFYCDQNIPNDFYIVGNTGFKSYSEVMSYAFQEIGFSDKMNNIFKLACCVDLPENAVALHLRAGDIVYGDFKKSIGYNGKSLCYPLAKTVIEDLTNTGKKVIIFGQDDYLIEYLSSLHTCAFNSSDFVPHGLDFLGKAFFEIYLMSRCNEIYAGTSGFPRLSHIISMNKHVLFDTYFKNNNKNKNKIILESLMRNEFDNFYISDEQLSFACKSALIYGGLTADEKALVIDLGIKSNVNVVFFRFYQCWDFYLTGQLSNGEEVLDSISKDLPDFLKFNISTPHQKRMFGKIFDFNALGCDESAPEIVKLRSYIF